MKTLRHLILSLGLLTLAFGAGAETAPYDDAKFKALSAQDKPVLLVMHADWCPTCRAQEPVVQQLTGTPEFKAYTVLKVDFDNQKDVVRAHRVPYQSTLIVFRKGEERGRSTAETRPEAIAALLRKGL